MQIGNLDIIINSYTGVLDGGVVILLNILCENTLYEGLYWYDEFYHLITIDKPLESIIGKIELHNNYNDILKYLRSKREDYYTAYSKLNTD